MTETFIRQAKRKIWREIAKSLITPAGMLIAGCLLLAYTTHRLGQFPSLF